MAYYVPSKTYRNSLKLSKGSLLARTLVSLYALTVVGMVYAAANANRELLALSVFLSLAINGVFVLKKNIFVKKGVHVSKLTYTELLVLEAELLRPTANGGWPEEQRAQRTEEFQAMLVAIDEAQQTFGMDSEQATEATAAVRPLYESLFTARPAHDVSLEFNR